VNAILFFLIRFLAILFYFERYRIYICLFDEGLKSIDRLSQLMP